MSDTFKYLDGNKQAPTEDAAQSFLNEKLSKNKYTKQQQDSLDANGGPTVANATEGFTPASSNEPSKSDGFKGSRSVEEIRKEFGLKYDANNAPAFDPSKTLKGRMQSDDGHIWYKDSAGQTQYLGQVAGGYERGSVGDDKPKEEAYRKGSDKSMFHADWNEDRNDAKDMKGKNHMSSNKVLQGAHDERNGAGHNNGFNSINDLALAMRYMINKESPEPVAKEPEPIEHSPEIKQAKERVKTYEDDILSGKTSEDIYGSGSDYAFDASKGAAGIGTPMNGDSNQQATKATASFLDNKKFQVKQKYQFQSQS